MYYVIDTETTGLNPAIHDIIQVGIVELDNRFMETYRDLEFQIKPERPEQADPKALEINGLDITQGISIGEAKNIIKDYIIRDDKHGLIGWNIMFDIPFFNKLFTRELGLELFFHRSYRDVLQYAKCIDDMAYLKSGLKLYKDHKLSSVKEFYGITTKGHTALSDAKATYQIMKRLLSETLNDHIQIRQMHKLKQ